ncbi:PREDICTED: mucin-5AC-like isoform X1 [Branchiostoma belcheri]|uniref:Mucin-5AC-like isoform X1 n=1 Tax=Branchiostoma belcheri TaxID=7741 RepID=A0A6P4ZFJ9_BRABE|nr:PREDICTED: mucin-5AC-like isoform X1 [Branchiostoma belcheri]
MNGWSPNPNDDERFYELRMKFDFCAEPSAIMCRDANAPGVPFTTGPGLTCDVTDGLYCQADLRPYSLCKDYELKVKCCVLPPHCVTTLRPTTRPPTTTTPPPTTTTAPPTTTTPPPTTTTAPPTTTTAPPTTTTAPPTTTTAPPTTTTAPPTTTTAPPTTTTPQPTTTTPVPTTTTSYCPDVCSVATLPPLAIIALFKILGYYPTEIPVGMTFTVENCKTYTCTDCGVIIVDNPECPPIISGLCANGKVPLYFSDGCCVHYACGCECIGWGDPHYMGMDGGYFPFQGLGDFILSQSTADDLFRVIATNVDCAELPNANFFYHNSPYGPNDIVTCTAAITLEHGGHTFRVDRYLQVFIDGAPTGYGTFNVGGVKAIRQFGNPNVVFYIEAHGIFVQFSNLGYKVTIRIEPGDLAAYGIEGLCGTCNNNQSDDCLEINPEECACEYLIENGLATIEDCIETSPPPPNENCTDLVDVCDEYLSANPTLNSLLEDCFKFVDPESFRRACRYDVAHCISECESIEAFVTTCFEESRRQDEPICIDWRIELPHCSLNCSESLIEKSCACERTCENPEGYCDDEDMIQDGCFCPDGFVLDNDQCVPEADCLHCVDDQGNIVPINSTWVPGGDSCQICTCRGPNYFTCEHVYCEPVEQPVCEGYCKVMRNVANFDPCCPEYECVCDIPCEHPDVPVCGYGYVPINVQDPDDCAPDYDCVCDVSTCDPNIPECNQFEELTITETDCCNIYSCVCVDCPPLPDITCEDGYEIIEVPFNFGCNCTTLECEPLPDYCIYIDTDFVDYLNSLGIPLPDDVSTEQTFYLPGDTWNAAFECLVCECLETVVEENHSHGGSLHEIECQPTQICDESCPLPCMEYQPSTIPGQCCGMCVRVPCCVVNPDGSETFHQVNETYGLPDDNCTVCQCYEMPAPPFGMPMVMDRCEPHICIPQDEIPYFCYHEPYSIETYYEGGPEGLCCERQRCTIRASPAEEVCQPHNFTDKLHYDEEGYDCESEEEVLHTYCEGQCTSQATVHTTEPFCPEGWHSEDGISCYKIIHEERDYLGAKDKCDELGGRLASFSNDEKEAYLRELLANYTGTMDLWVGLVLDHSTYYWTWTDGMETDLDTDWSTNPPMGDCGATTPSGYFDKKFCDGAMPFICERAPSTIVRDLCRCCTVSQYEEQHVAMTCATGHSFYFTHRIITDCICEEHFCEDEDYHVIEG